MKNDDITFAKPWLYTKSVGFRIEPYVINKEIFTNRYITFDGGYYKF
ncbi:MAG: hypothetical protein NTV87_16850 [Ignavibacteriae bacterium]|nr:hypothetical protein [Ignavibacteriota bacterium]